MATSSLFEFPCQFPIKAIGRAQPHFDALVVEIIRPHVPDLAENAVTLNQGERWAAVTVVIQANSQAQIDAIYQALSTHAAVHLTL